MYSLHTMPNIITSTSPELASSNLPEEELDLDEKVKEIKSGLELMPDEQLLQMARSQLRSEPDVSNNPSYTNILITRIENGESLEMLERYLSCQFSPVETQDGMECICRAACNCETAKEKDLQGNVNRIHKEMKKSVIRLIGQGRNMAEIVGVLENRRDVTEDRNVEASTASSDGNVAVDIYSWLEVSGEELILKALESEAGCSEDHCRDAFCQWGRFIVNHVGTCLLQRLVISSRPAQKVVSAILHHSNDCSVHRCSLFLCNLLSYHINKEGSEDIRTVTGQLQNLIRRFDLDDDGHLLNVGVAPDSFHLIDPNLRLGEVDVPPRAGDDYKIYGRYNHSTDFMKTGRLRFFAVSTRLDVPVQFLLLSRLNMHLERASSKLWKKMYGVQHENIVRHLFVTLDSRLMTFCTERNGVELTLVDWLRREYRNEAKIRDTYYQDVLKLMNGLLSGLQFLHEKGVYFLNWIASAIEIVEVSSDMNKIAKLSDFSCAIGRDSADDIDLIKNALPAHSLPPEIFEEDIGSVASGADLWGFGCLLYHMTTGQPVHYDQRHGPRNYQPQQGDQGPQRQIVRDHTTYRSKDLIRDCRLQLHKHVKCSAVEEILLEIFQPRNSRIDLKKLKQLFKKHINP